MRAAGEAGAPAGVFAPTSAGPWLFGRSTDLWLFGGSALASFALLGLGLALGIANADAPAWIWIACVLGVDVAHVWSTAFRVYLDGEEVRRRPVLYLGLPVVCYGLGVMAHALSALAFWRALAYVAVFHFVRQQYGWVAMYRRRAGEHGTLDRWLDTATIYAATLYPLLWWHGHLPRRFAWFVQDDFVAGLSGPLSEALSPLYWGLAAAFVLRQLWLLADGQRPNAGKVLVVTTTWTLWHVGIIALDGDYAFTVTNVLIHGVPYMALTYRYGRARRAAMPRPTGLAMLRFGALGFVFFVLVLAFLEESLWDRLVWHERPELFGAGTELTSTALVFLVPLLALPQALHYALDGFVWRTRDNPTLAAELSR